MRDIKDISLRELLPPSIADDPDIQAAADAIDAELQKTARHIPSLAIVKRLRNGEITDPALLDMLAWGLHVDFYGPDMPLEVRQALVAKSLDWHTRKGTPSVVEEIVTSVFSDAEVSEWFEYDGLLNRFKISTEYTDANPAAIQRLVDAIFSVKNVRSWLDGIEIVRNLHTGIRIGGAVHQEVTNHLAPAPIEIDVSKATHCFAAFIYFFPSVTIEGE